MSGAHCFDVPFCKLIARLHVSAYVVLCVVCCVCGCVSQKEAVDAGAFGAPWIILDLPTGRESYFGSDRFEFIAHQLSKFTPTRYHTMTSQH